VAIIFTAIWLGIYQNLDKIVWSNAFVAAHRWAIPLGVMLFSLLVGLAQKYLRAPTVIHGGGLADSMKGGARVDYSTFWGALVSSYSSLLSGASVGPEGPLGILVQDLAAWAQEKLKIARETALGFQVAALASAYNGIIGSPLFTGVFATEFQVGGSTALLYLTWNLLAGVIGFFTYTLLHLHGFAQYIPFTPISGLSLAYLLFAIALGIVGAALALCTGVAFQVFGRLIQRVFQERVVWRALAAGVVIAIVVSFVPSVMFAGETQIFPMIHHPASYGVLALLGLGVLKLLLLALSFKSGYLGGPTFPVLFICTMIGLALSLLFPGVPVSIFVLCIEVGAITFLLQAPLTAILLVAVIGTADSYTIALLVVSSVVALIVGGGVKRLRARRTHQAAVASQRRIA
jgi:H+/Cl- antiporter ClcA